MGLKVFVKGEPDIFLRAWRKLSDDFQRTFERGAALERVAMGREDLVESLRWRTSIDRRSLCTLINYCCRQPCNDDEPASASPWCGGYSDE